MNIRQDDYQELLNQIAIVADRSFSEQQVLALMDTMQTLGWHGSYRTVMGVIRSGNLPKNIYGHTLLLLEEEIARIRKAFCDRKDWHVSRENCVTSEEFRLTMRCIGMIARFPRSGDLFERFSEYLRDAQERGILLQALKHSVMYYTDLLDATKEKKHEGVL